jgi:SAM-dependent methyltransferase
MGSEAMTLHLRAFALVSTGFLLSAISCAHPQATIPGRQTELADPRDAGWFYRSERVDSEKPDALLDVLGIGEGDVVADIGSGGGFFSLLAADRVGATGRVLAVDVQAEMIDGLRRMMKRTGREIIVAILGEEDNPKLPANHLDHVLIVLAYHEFSKPAAMLGHIRDAMKPDARLLLVEYKSEDPDSRVGPRHKMSEAQIMNEIPAMGFWRESVIDIVPGQHVFVFRKTDAHVH